MWALDEDPVFPGGLEAFYAFVKKNLRYPADASEFGESGKVSARFVIGRDGFIKEVRIMEGVSRSLDNEVIRVLKLSPQWTPGKIGKQTVPVYYDVPVSFKL